MAQHGRKRSLVPLLNLGVDIYQVKKLGKMSNELESLRAGNARNASNLNSVLELSIAHNEMLRGVDSKLEKLSEISWNIASHFERKEAREEFTASMRYSIFTLSKKLDQVNSFMSDFPEFARLDVDIIEDMIDERDLRAEHFAFVSQDEMERAQAFLDRVFQTKSEIISILTERKSIGDYRFLRETMENVIELEESVKNIEIEIGQIKSDIEDLHAKKSPLEKIKTENQKRLSSENTQRVDDVKSSIDSISNSLSEDAKSEDRGMKVGVASFLLGIGIITYGQTINDAFYENMGIFFTCCLPLFPIFLWGNKTSSDDKVELRKLESEIGEIEPMSPNESEELSNEIIRIGGMIGDNESKIDTLEAEMVENKAAIEGLMDSVKRFIPFSDTL